MNTTPEQAELGNCPFCNHTAMLTDHGPDARPYQICCGEQDEEKCPWNPHAFFATVEEAATAWNTRATQPVSVPQEVVDLIARLEAVPEKAIMKLPTAQPFFSAQIFIGEICHQAARALAAMPRQKAVSEDMIRNAALELWQRFSKALPGTDFKDAPDRHSFIETARIILLKSGVVKEGV